MDVPPTAVISDYQVRWRMLEMGEEEEEGNLTRKLTATTIAVERDTVIKLNGMRAEVTFEAFRERISCPSLGKREAGREVERLWRRSVDKHTLKSQQGNSLVHFIISWWRLTQGRSLTTLGV